jgi:hypothetical protein
MKKNVVKAVVENSIIFGGIEGTLLDHFNIGQRVVIIDEDWFNTLKDPEALEGDDE